MQTDHPPSQQRPAAQPVRLNFAQGMMFPDIAMILALVVFFSAMLGGDGPQRLLSDSDTGWHIVTGERILATGEFPKTEPYSFSRPGGAWFAWEWLADVLLGWVHMHLGLAGIAFLAAAAIALPAWLWARLSRAVGGNPFIAGALMGLAMTCTTIHWLARPHIFSWSFLIVWVWMMERAPSRLRWFHAAGVGAFFALWTNIHGSFVLAFPIAAIYILGYWTEDRTAESRAKAWWIGVVTASGLVATLANPYGLTLYPHLLHYLANGELLSQISEFQSYNFSKEGGLFVMVLFLIALWGAVLAAQQKKWARALLILMFLTIAMRSARGIPLLALVALPVVNASITARLRGVARMRGFFEEAEGFLALEKQSNGLLWMAGALGAAVWMFSLPAVQAVSTFPAKNFPVQTAACLAKEPASARVFSTDYFGGYLIYRFRGARPVYFDGRSDYYGVAFLHEYNKISGVVPGWRELFGAYSFTHALVPKDAPLRDALGREGWRTLCEDKVSVLMSRGEAKTP